MPDEIRVARPSQQAPMKPAETPPMPAPMAEPAKMPSSSKMPWIILALVIVVLVVLGVLFRDKLMGKSPAPAASAPSGYQAVFLTNGQVYFGKVSDLEKEYLTMKDIYYLQVVQPPLQGQQSPGQTQAQAQAQPQISLVKLGNELHGPVDEMHISKSQILFYEDMKSDGKVVQAINAYKANPQSSAAPAALPAK